LYCPKCLAEYVPGYTRCFDCDLPLVEELPSPPKRARRSKLPDPFVTVLATGDQGLMAIAKSLLQSAEIPFMVQGEGVQELFGAGCLGTGFNLVTGPAKLLIHADDADEVRALLADLSADEDADEVHPRSAAVPAARASRSARERRDRQQ
jgi:hypothetical protein